MEQKKKVEYPLSFQERRRRIENPTYEESEQDASREEILRNRSRNSR